MTRMWTRAGIEEMLSHRTVAPRFWGSMGPLALAAVEEGLGFALPPEVRQFALGVGNADVGPFQIVVTGNVPRAKGPVLSCVTQTEHLRVRNPCAPRHLINLAEHAGSVYCVSSEDGTASSYDHFYVEEGAEILRWGSFGELFEYLVQTAEEIDVAVMDFHC